MPCRSWPTASSTARWPCPASRRAAIARWPRPPDALFYIKAADGDDGDTTLLRFDLKERKEEKVVDGVSDYVLSRDGKKLLYRVKDDWFLADAKAGLKAGDGKVDLAGLRVKADSRAEWVQMFEDAWRIARDWFYDPNMHGVDWAAMKKKYGALVPFVAHRADLDFIFGEMLGELEAGHTYVASGDEPKVPRVLGGMLGAELVADPSGRYRIARIYAGRELGRRLPLAAHRDRACA